MDRYVDEQIKKEHPEISQVEDLGWLQWGQGTGSPLHQSVAKSRNLPGIPEIYFFAQDVLHLGKDVRYDLGTSKQVLNGSKPLFDPQNLIDFIAYYANGDYDSIARIWGLRDKILVDTLRTYIAYIRHTFVDNLFRTEPSRTAVG